MKKENRMKKETGKRLYIAYGSNMNLPQMERRCPTAKVIGVSELKDYELLFRGGRTGAVATVEPKPGASVPVLVWEIQPMDERALDCYEGYPYLYGKQMAEVELEGEKLETMVYVMKPRHRLGMPGPHYEQVIREGYQTAGIDEKILDEAIRHAAKLLEQQTEEPAWQHLQF